MEQVAADGQLLQKLRVCRMAHIGIAVVLFVPARVVAHRLLQCLGDAHIIYHEPALFVPEHPVDPGNGLHQIVSGHGLIDVHGGQ